MEQVMHAARLAAAYDALFALLVEQLVQDIPLLDGISAHLTYEDDQTNIEITYFRNGKPVNGQGF